MNDNAILIVGAGPMAQEYAKVFKDMEMEMIVVGRNKDSAREFEKKTEIPAQTGGIKQWLKNNSHALPKKAVVCVHEKGLGAIAVDLIISGIQSILLEKPGGYNGDDIRHVAEAAKKYSAEVYVAYNRRFYESARVAQKIIHEDGGILSFIFEFTEWGHKIPETKKISGETQEWFLANSTHVIDLAFFLGGKPKKISSYTSRGVDWHRHASVYSGAGITEKNALFSYHANWESAGRWNIEIMTPKQRLILKPLEKLYSIDLGSIAVKEIAVDDSLDQKFKPGLYRQVASFLENKKNIPTIFDQVDMLYWYEEINKTIKNT